MIKREKFERNANFRFSFRQTDVSNSTACIAILSSISSCNASPEKDNKETNKNKSTKCFFVKYDAYFSFTFEHRTL
jgi:hypothetical protein